MRRDVLQSRCLVRAPQRASARSSSSSCSSSSSSCSSSADGQKGIFDREAELQELDSLRCKRPAGVTVVLGPRSCGKTAVLQDLFAKQDDAVYIDCRVIDAATPAGLIEVLLSKLATKVPVDLQESAKTALSKVPGVLAGLLSSMKLTEKDATLSMVSITIPDLVKAFLGSKERQQNLNAVYDALRELLTVLEKRRADDGSRWPVVVIDEANKLMKWTDKYPEELDSFLSNLVALSKQENRCHVFLATSEYAFQAWLSDAIGPRFWNAEVIGDFPKAAARRFLELELEQQASSSILGDEAWRKVFQVCGGNAGDLRRLAVQVDSRGGDWDAALEVLWGGELTRIKVLAQGGDGWTAAQYADIMLQLLDSKYHATPLEDAWMLLGQHSRATTPDIQQQAGTAVLQRLVAANALSVRPKSAWASDIPSEAFAADAAVVTAPSSLDLYCIGQLRSRLEQMMQRWKEQQQQDYEQVAVTAGAAAEATRPPSPGSSPEVKEVKQQILLVGQQLERVEQQIEQVEQDIKEAKQQGDREEVAVLRSKEQQLRSKEQQLRSKEQQLREELLLLLRIYAGNGS